jgi:hypothetical protein
MAAGSLEHTAVEPKTVGGASASLPWLFSAPVDLSVFGGSAVASLVLLWIGGLLGILHSTTPDWAWVPAVLLVDVAHVWATGFRVYFDTAEFRRRPLLYILVPVLGFALAIAVYSEGTDVFWRVLAYVAVFHFVRQQYGWVALYRARAGDRERVGRWIDTAAVYLATIYPLIYWHAHGRLFDWFDVKYQAGSGFVSIPEIVERIVWPIYLLAMALYVGRAVYLWFVIRRPNPGKDLVVFTTALCWYLGIITFNSDYAFTVTNVLIHGVPYFALVYCYRVKGGGWRVEGRARRVKGVSGVVFFLGALWFCAYVEEMLWDRGIWQERGWLFGSAWNIGAWRMAMVPLLALPQITHYILDGFIWRRRSNPELRSRIDR